VADVSSVASALDNGTLQFMAGGDTAEEEGWAKDLVN
jgi:hypothetical protein